MKQLVRKIGISLIGFPLLIIGIILIPLPGPGLIVCLAGLAILSLEFPWAKNYVDQTKTAISKIKDKASVGASNNKT